MNHSTVCGMLLLCATASLASACTEAETEEKEQPASYIVPTSETLSGKSYEGLAAEWWQWVRAIPAEQNPLLDAPCNVQQEGPVFFLAGNFGGTGTRSCAVPADKALFFPLFNVSYSSCPEIVKDESYTCDQAKSEEYLHTSAKALMDTEGIALTLEIDGVAIPDLMGYRAASKTFTDSAAAGPSELLGDCSGPIRENTCGISVDSTRKMAADGYWIMLRPLPPGEHKLHFGGNVTFPDKTTFGTDLTYTLTVAP